jgi:hypothetical protein
MLAQDLDQRLGILHYLRGIFSRYETNAQNRGGLGGIAAGEYAHPCCSR